MNILFIDNKSIEIKSKLKKYIYKIFGFYLQKDRNINVSCLNINLDNLNTKFLGNVVKVLFKEEKVYIILSRYLTNNIKIKEILDNNIKDKIFVTEQNNLYQNDIKYIDKYISRNSLKRKDIKILFVIDSINTSIKKKFEFFIKQYKVVDILINNKSSYGAIKSYVDNFNKEEGTTVEILDNLNSQIYNIILIFSKDYKLKYDTANLFILDYNDSDLDVESNTYLIYKNNKDKFIYLFNKFNMDISNFEKTKLGKLYIHAGRLILDK